MTTTACSATQKVIEVLLIDRAGQPVADVGVTLLDASLQTSLCSGPDGLCRFEGLADKPYAIALPEVDDELWEFEGDTVLHEQRQKGSAARTWNDVEGEVPTSADATIGRLHYIRLTGLPEMLSLRFLHLDGSPRANEPYVGVAVHADGSEEEAFDGSTSAGGFLTFDRPLDAAYVEVTIGNDDAEEVYRVWLNEFAPAADPHGLQTRLTALGYYAGEIDGKVGDLTTEAIAAFQEDLGRDVTGEADEDTLAALEKMFGS